MPSLRQAIVKPVVLIHCWGGLGSQLHAWHLLELVKLQHPRRNFSLVFHTAGVTRRLPEIEELLSVNESRWIDDYHPSSSHGRGLRSQNFGLARIIKNWTKHFLSFLGVENNHESLERLIRVYPWTKIIRGHYSRIPINNVALERISSKIFSSAENQLDENFRKLVVHLRLGDLRDLAEKSPTDEDSLRQVLSKLSDCVTINQTIVHSDSPDLVYSFLGSSSRNTLIIRDLAVTPLSALVEMVESDYFVGTSSKLSLWASIFRSKLGKVQTYMPKNMTAALMDLIGEDAKRIQFYD